jgi:hypothetical protein
LAYLLASGGDVLRAQNAPGNIVGHVSDPTGQAIVGAKVTVRNSGTNVTNTFTTNGTGDYVVVNLLPGNYDVNRRGSRLSDRAGHRVGSSGGTDITQNFSLELGAVTQQVTVSSRDAR